MHVFTVAKLEIYSEQKGNYLELYATGRERNEGISHSMKPKQ